MRIAYDRPPNWDLLVAVFHVDHKPTVIFCYGDTIYNPWRVSITKALHAHEEAHSVRQLAYAPAEGPHAAGDHVDAGCCWTDPVVAWWARYCASTEFRLYEEYPAHVAEYREYCKRHSRGVHERYLREVSIKLASPLYGRLCTPQQARRAIITGSIKALTGGTDGQQKAA